MKKAVVYFTHFASTYGGSEYLPLALVAELQKTHRVTLALDWESDVARAARAIGIPVDVDALEIVAIKPKNKFLGRLDAILPFCRTRRLKALAKDADLCISAANPMDFGKPAHHFVYLLAQFGDNAFKDAVRNVPPPVGLSAMKRRVRTFLAERFLRPALGLRSTRTILADFRERIYPNSRYADRTMRAFYGDFNGTVFYPPTTFEFPRTDETRRDPLRVVCLGRVIPSKRVTDIIDIVGRARALSGADIRLSVGGPTAPGSPYEAEIRRLAAARPWMELVGPVYGEKKAALLASGAFAVHACRDEAFGIAVAEYLKAGTVVLVPNEGGSAEVVDAPELMYRTNDEAAQILSRLVSDEEFREKQRRHCRERALEFSRERYFERQHALLSEILGQ